jgi:hypothetical protein
VRIWVPDLVHWSGDRRALSLSVENGSDRPVRLEAPGPTRVRITLFLGPGPDRACGVEPDTSREPGSTVTLAPGEATPVTVDLAKACGRLLPGEYRYEVAYEAPSLAKGPPLRTRARYGHVLVDADRNCPEPGSLGSSGGGRTR